MKNQIDNIVAGFKQNCKKPSYWVQIVGSVVVVGLVVAHYVWDISLNSDLAIMIPLIVGSLLALWGTVTNNGVLVTAGNQLKDDSNTMAKAADDVAGAIDTAVSELQATKTVLIDKTQAASSAVASNSAQNSAVASAYSAAQSAAAAGDMVMAKSAASMASSLTSSTDSSATSSAN